MRPRFMFLKKAVSSLPFLVFLMLVGLLILLTSMYVALKDYDTIADTDVYWYVAVAVMAITAIIFLICAFLCPSCMTPARQQALDESVLYYNNPERGFIGRDNYGANVRPQLLNARGYPILSYEDPYSLIHASRSIPATDIHFPAPPPTPDVRRAPNSRRWSAPPPPYSAISSHTILMRGQPPSRRTRSRGLEETTPSQAGIDHPDVAQSSPGPETTNDAQVNPSLALADPAPPLDAGNEDGEPVSACSTPQQPPETESNRNTTRVASSSPSTRTGSGTERDSNSTLTSASNEDGLGRPDENARRIIASHLPFHTRQSVPESRTPMQKISAERHSSLTLVHQSPRTPVSSDRRLGTTYHPNDAFCDHSSIGHVGSSDNETPVPEEEIESVVVAASRVGSPVPEEEVETEPVSHSDVTIDMKKKDEVKTEVGLVLQLAGSLLEAAWSSMGRWIRPQRDLTTAVKTQVSPESPQSSENRIVASPGRENEEPSPEKHSASAHARVNMAECTEPSQQGEDVVPPERRERP